ncbi:hypothetical protein Z046_27485 [Pseudomonas aeruginosa VRFPA09]|nr:hypothetical protein Z046_27485 [Pseudomonas aeruginosa VRFPA09]
MTAALPDLSFHPAWHAQLELAYARAGDATRARAWLIELWRLLRPALLGREAVPPRIWST